MIWLQTQKEVTKTQSQFLDMLARFDLKITYLKGELNVPADAPSRRPDYHEIVSTYALKDRILALETQLEKANAKVRTLVRPQADDMHTWLSRIENGYRADKAYQEGAETDEFAVIENQGFKLWYHTTKGDDLPPTLCVPEDSALRDRILKEYHGSSTSGHLRGELMYKDMRRAYYWSTMRQDAIAYASSCTMCQTNTHDHRLKPGFMAEFERPARPWASVSVDFYGPLTAAKDDKDKTKPNSVLVAICRLTKMVHFIPCRNDMNAAQTADLFISNIVKLHGIPEEFRSDRDKVFVSEFWKRVWEKLGTTIALSVAHHHQSAGQAERANPELRRYLAIYCRKHKDWAENLTFAEFAFNARVNKSTSLSPFELNYGFKPKTPADLMSPPLPEEERTKAAKNADGWLTTFIGKQLASSSRSNKSAMKTHTTGRGARSHGTLE